MATLHVRNVPDELYEELRKRAERDGRSIGAEAIALLRFALIDRARVYGSVEPARARAEDAVHASFRRPGAGRSSRERKSSAGELGSPEVTPAHVLLAMLEDDVLRPTLERRGITEEAVRAVLPSGPPRTGPRPISAEARQMLEQALLQSLGLSPLVMRAFPDPCALRPRWRGGSCGSSRSTSGTARGYARPPSASGTSTATRTWRRSGSTAGSTWRSRRRPEVPFVVVVDGRAGRLVALPERRAVAPARRDRLDVARARPLGHRGERRGEVPAAPERVRGLGRDAGRVQDGRPEPARPRRAPRGRGRASTGSSAST